MYAAAAVGLMMACATITPQPSSAALTTSSQPSRSLLTFSDDSDGTANGSYGGEGDEGIDQALLSQDEGHTDDRTGDGLNEGDGGYEGDETLEGDEGNQGNEGDEGDEGNEGDQVLVPARPILCARQTHALLPTVTSAHAALISTISAELCPTGRNGSVATAAAAADAPARKLVRALADVQTFCAPAGVQFNCTISSTIADSWAAVSTVDHASAVAAAAGACGCVAAAPESALADSAAFLTLVADVFTRVDSFACTGSLPGGAEADYVECGSISYATTWLNAVAKAFLDSSCFSSEGAARIRADFADRFDDSNGVPRSRGDQTCRRILNPIA